MDVAKERAVTREISEDLRKQSRERQEKGKETYSRLLDSHNLAKDRSQVMLINGATEGFKEATKFFKTTVFGEGFESLIVLKKPIKSVSGEGEIVVGVTNNGHVFKFPSWEMPRDLTTRNRPDDPGIEIITENGAKFTIDFRKMIAPRNPGSDGITEAKIDSLFSQAILQIQKPAFPLAS